MAKNRIPDPIPAGYNSARALLKSLIERIDRLEEEKREVAESISDVYKEAKDSGFDTKIMRKLVAERRMQEHDWREQEKLLDLYRQALGMTPIERAIAEAAE